MNRLVAEKQVPVWTWRVRWFVPKQKEEFSVNLLPTGELVGFRHVVEEEATGITVTLEQAQQIAARYLKRDGGLAMEEWELYDQSSETLPHRTDHHFTWVKQGLQIGDGDVRASVSIQGDQVGRFSTWLRVPEAFSRDYSEQRSRAGLIGHLAYSAGYYLFFIGGALVLAWGLLKGLRVGWTPIVIGLIAGLIDLLDSLNWLPWIKIGYSTAVDYSTYILNYLLLYLGNAAYQLIVVTLLCTASLWLLRAVWPRQHKLTPAAEDRWGNLARSSWRGMMLGGLMMAYLILFYAIARALGAWSPIKTPSLNLLATPLPFLSAIWIGLLPALTEELQYRALGIGLMMRLGKGRVWLTLLIPSLLWGFAHASYITDPIALRGLELTISSLLLEGLFFLLFDLTTAIVAHYTYNASLIAIVLIRSGRPALIVTGLVAWLLGLLPALVVLGQSWTGRRRRPSVALHVVAGDEPDWPAVEALGGRRLRGRYDRQGLVCLKDQAGRLYGYGLGVILERKEAPIGVVTGIYVAQGHRRRYRGTALYQALRAWFREQGARQVKVRLPLKQRGLTTFWLLQGLRPAARVLQQTLERPDGEAEESGQ